MNRPVAQHFNKLTHAYNESADCCVESWVFVLIEGRCANAC